MKVENKKLSVIVTSYNNFHYLYECLESIINQTYDNIEIIITDDGSYDFIRGGLEFWFKLYSGDNVKNIVINQNSNNLGTVKNVNIGLKHAKGDVITMIAADDKYRNENVFTLAMRKMEILPEDALVLTTQVDMCNQWLQPLHPFMNDRVLNTLRYGSVNDLLKLELLGSLLPSCGTFYKKEVFERFGLCDERYDLIEDHVLHLKLLKAGVRFYYLDETSVIHRAGGVSHGTEGASKSPRFWKDCMNVFDNEVMPLVDMYLDENEKHEFNETYKRTKAHYQAATGEAVSSFEIISSKKAVFLDMLTNIIAFLSPRVHEMAKYLFALGVLLCILPRLFESIQVPFIDKAFEIGHASIYGGILMIISTAVFVLNEIPQMFVKLLLIKRRFSNIPIARYLEAIWIDED